MTSGSILRGSLRPGSGRTPPFLIIGLLVICGILGYNYWNLSAEYDALVKEIGALQDKFRIVALKREHAEKQSDAVERRFNEAESEIGKIKISVFQKDQELTKAGAKIESQNVELENLRDQIKACQALNVQINTSKDKLEDLRKKLDVSNTEKEQLQGEKQKLITERQDMRLKLEELTFKLAHFTQQRDNYLRPEPPVPPVSGKNSVQGENTVSVQPAADDNKDEQVNGNDINAGINEERLPLSGNVQEEAIQQNEKDGANEKVADGHANQDRPDTTLTNTILETPVNENGASWKNPVDKDVESVNGNVQNSGNKLEPIAPVGMKNNTLPKRVAGGTGDHLIINYTQNNEVAPNTNNDAVNSNKLETNRANIEEMNTITTSSNIFHNPNADDIQSGKHEDIEHVQSEGPVVIRGHKVGDVVEDPSFMTQIETDAAEKQVKEPLQTYDGTFVKDDDTMKDALKNSVGKDSKDKTPPPPVEQVDALNAPVAANAENGATNNANLTAALKETDNVGLNPDVDYPSNKQPVPAPVVGQENLSGNGVGLGGGEEMPQGIHAIPHTKDNGDYVDSKNVAAGIAVPKPADDEKEGEDNDIPVDKMKDTLKLPADQAAIPRDDTNNKFNRRRNVPANMAIVGKSNMHPGLFSPFRNEGTLGKDQTQS